MNNLNPPFVKNFLKFSSSHYSSRKPYDLKHVRPNQVTFGSNSLESVGPQIWNGLPNKMKSAENLTNFKLMIKQWNGPANAVPTIVLLLLNNRFFLNILILFDLDQLTFFLLPYKIQKLQSLCKFSMAATAGKDMISASSNYDGHLH